MMTAQILAQIFAILFLVAFALSYHAKSRGKILLIQIAGLIFYGINFLLLHAWSGMAMVLIQSITLIFFINKDKHALLKSNFVLYFFLLVYLIFTIFTWEGFFSIFSFIGVGLATTAKWQNKVHHIRIISIPASVSWIIYDIFVASYGGIFAEVVLMTSIIISIMKNKAKEELAA